MEVPWLLIVSVIGWTLLAIQRERRKAQEAEASRALADVDVSWLNPPEDMHAAGPWDGFWRAQIEHEVAGFTDLCVDDRPLLQVCEARGFTTVLCIGAGLSFEPHALAAGGLAVTVLDISPFVVEAVGGLSLPDEAYERFLDAAQKRPGGSVRCVAGDLTDRSVCPGPFDLVVERRTLQLFRGERRAALEAVAARMAPKGVLFTQSHNGAWRPGQPCEHHLETLFGKCGFLRGTLESAKSAGDGRTVITLVTTG
jgi:hypothetical protein